MNIQMGSRRCDQSDEPVQPIMSERRVAITGGLLVAIGSMSMALYTPAMTEIMHAFGSTKAMVQLTLSVYFGGFCVAQLVCGPLSDGFGRRPVTIAFMGIYLVGSLLALVSSSMDALLFARFLQGVGAAVGVTVSRAIVRDLFTNEASARVMNMIGLVIAVGPAVAPTIGGLTMQYFGWHAIFLVMVLLGLLVVLMAIFVIRETGVPDRKHLRPKELLHAYAVLLRSPHFMYSSLAVGGTTGALYTAAVILPFILMQQVGMSATAFGLGLLLQTGSYLAGGLLFRSMMKYYSSRQLAIVGYMVIALASVLMAIILQVFPASYLSVMLPMGLYAFGIALVMPLMMSAGMAPFPHMAGSASALMGFFQMGGGMVGGAIAALMVDPVFAMATVIPLMGLAALVGFLLWLRLPEPVIA